MKKSKFTSDTDHFYYQAGGSGYQREQVVAVMERLKAHYDTMPERIKVDNGSEFISKSLDKWPMITRSRWTSPDWENPLILPLLNTLMAVSGMNV